METHYSRSFLLFHMYSKIKEMYFYSGVSFACKWKNEIFYVDMRGTTSVLFTRKLTNCFLHMLWGLRGFFPIKVVLKKSE